MQLVRYSRYAFIFFILFVLPPQAGLMAQQVGSSLFRVDWTSSSASSFRFRGMSYLPGNGQPQFCQSLAVGTLKKVDLNLEVLATEPLSARERESFSLQDLSDQPRLEQFMGFGSAGNRASFCFVPLRRRNGQWEKITRFRMRWQAAPERSQASFPVRKKTRANSVLANGTWHKLTVAETGLHRITPRFLSENAIANQAVSINSLRVVGNGTGMLPEAMAQSRPDDLNEVPLKVVDSDGDGLFNNNDYAIFYAQGSHQWQYNSTENRFDHQLNIYRDRNHYFLSVDQGSSPTPSLLPSVTDPANQTVSAFDDYAYVEDEERNLIGTGRQWFGDAFEFTLSYNYDFRFPNLITSEPVELLVNAVGRVSTNGTQLLTRYLGQQILSNPIDAYPTGGQYPAFVQRSARRTSFIAQGDNLTLNLNFDNAANPAGVVWLDKIELQVRRALRMDGSALYFRDSRSIGSGNISEFVIGNATDAVEVWEVSSGAPVRRIGGRFVSGTYRFRLPTDSLREFVAFRGSDFPLPGYLGSVPNQNLHAMPVPEMVIISHPDFLETAREIAEFHNQTGNVAAQTVSTEEVYNEYSSGGQDITGIRDFIRSLYQRSTGGRFKYVLLFGDASYDYKDRLNGNNNFVPVWQSDYSFSLGLSFITDDYYAYLDPGEATQSLFVGSVMDIGVGRIPVENRTQARQYLEKMKAYVASEASLGDWRNRILLMADDVDEIWERAYFIPASEELERLTYRASKAFNVEKIYTDAYQQQTTTGGQTYPEASRDMFRKVQQGCLLVNYIGHGGEIGLASEKLLELDDVNGWTNFNALPLFVTVTCEFTRFDDPNRVSAGEQLLRNRAGGAIGLLTTTRVVGVQGAVDLNEAVFDTIVARPNGQPQTFGQIIKAAKNDPFVVGNSTKTKFSLIGDPALRLPIPFLNVYTDSINGKSTATALNDTLKALSKVTLSGAVTDAQGQLRSDFNGVLRLSVFDKPNRRETLVNDGVGAPQPFEVQNSLIYRGKVGVQAGRFTAEFRVPQDISYRFGNGKISYYAADSERFLDGAGYFDTVAVGGFDENAPSDAVGPDIELFLNDRNFVRGGITGPDPVLLAVLRDSSGINTVGNGVGHDLKAVLDGRTDQPFILNEFYEADLNSYQSGEVRYQLFALENGEHTLELQAFDIYNNPSEAQTEFIVAEDEELVLRRVLNYPNPFTTYTEFHFEHNRAGQPLEVQVQIFTVSGKLVKTVNATVSSPGNRVTGIAWNGLDDYGDKIGKGVYVYRVQVRSTLDNSAADKYEKLVILR